MYKILALLNVNEEIDIEYILKQVQNNNQNVHIIQRYTNNPASKYYIPQEEFTHKLIDLELLEAAYSDDGWCYGTVASDLQEDKINIGVYTLDGYNVLYDIPDIELYPIYFSIPNKARLLYLLLSYPDWDALDVIQHFNGEYMDYQYVAEDLTEKQQLTQDVVLIKETVIDYIQDIVKNWADLIN